MALYCHPKALQIPPASTLLSASGPLPRPLWEGLRVVLDPLTLALMATALHLKTSCPLPSCEQLRELPLALAPGKNYQSILVEHPRCVKRYTGMCFLDVISFNEDAIQILKALL